MVGMNRHGALLRRLLDWREYQERKIPFREEELPARLSSRRPFPWQLRVQGAKETKCYVDLETGEAHCDYEKRSKPPKEDCRQPWCPHRLLMRGRVVKRHLVRLHRAPEKKRVAVGFLLQRDTEEETALEHINRIWGANSPLRDHPDYAWYFDKRYGRRR